MSDAGTGRGASPGGRVITVVRLATPGPALGAADLRRLLERTAPAYRAVPGLVRKWYLSADGLGGGLYEWRSRAAAEAWFDAAWRERIRASYGVEPSIEWFDSPCLVDNEAGRIDYGGPTP